MTNEQFDLLLKAINGSHASKPPADKWNKLTAIATGLIAIATIVIPAATGVFGWGERLAKLESGQGEVKSQITDLKTDIKGQIVELKTAMDERDKPDSLFMRNIKLVVIEAQQPKKSDP